MHMLEEWAKKSLWKRKRTDDTPGPTPKKPTTSGPPGQSGPSGQPEPLTPDCSIYTPVVDPTPAAEPTSTAQPTPAADPTPGVCPPILASPLIWHLPVCPLVVCPLPVCHLSVYPLPDGPLLVCPLLVCPLPVCPLPVCPLPVCPLLDCPFLVYSLLVCPLPVHCPPMPNTLGGLFCGGLQGLDDHNPLAKWVAQSWPIWHHHAIYVANCVRYHNDDKDTIRFLDFRWSHGTIQGPKLQNISQLSQPGARYIGLIYESGGLLRSLPWEKMVFIERDEDFSIWVKLTWDEDIPKPVLLVLLQAVPDADGGRLLASVWWILC